MTGTRARGVRECARARARGVRECARAFLEGGTAKKCWEGKRKRNYNYNNTIFQNY